MFTHTTVPKRSIGVNIEIRIITQYTAIALETNNFHFGFWLFGLQCLRIAYMESNTESCMHKFRAHRVVFSTDLCARFGRERSIKVDNWIVCKRDESNFHTILFFSFAAQATNTSFYVRSFCAVRPTQSESNCSIAVFGLDLYGACCSMCVASLFFSIFCDFFSAVCIRSCFC